MKLYSQYGSYKKKAILKHRNFKQEYKFHTFFYLFIKKRNLEAFIFKCNLAGSRFESGFMTEAVLSWLVKSDLQDLDSIELQP